MSTQQQDQHWNARATEIIQLNPSASLTKDRASSPNQLDWKYLGRVWGATRRRAIKEGSKVVNRDWVNYQACSLSHNIYIVVGSFIMNDYLFKLVRKNHSIQQFFKFMH